jgi:hypothetical protein
MFHIKIKIIYVLSGIILYVLSGCGSLSEKKIISNYYLISTDYDNQTISLEYKLNKPSDYIGVVDETVFAVGFNNKFIIIKQHPRKFPSAPNKLITNYYIVPIIDTPTLWPEKGVIGPLTESDFEKQRKIAGVPASLTFTIFVKGEK